MEPKRPTVLVVDDDAIWRETLDSILGPMGYRVLRAGDPEGAFALLDAVAVDAVLLDIRMPTMSGLALHQAVVHRRPELEGCIAFMSAEPDAPDVRPWLEHHQSTVFRKPLQLDALTRWIDGVAEERAGRRRAHG
jgi:CheY-like chemotaxis protein